ncbi:hypothetical protein [Acinetobacter sp. ANC 4648]|uniref:hypothetical protein n=1 Tax=Acinetobacter sp. ANC 4648 TaxID=1977875 RepID=UPI000A3489C3|nr:hypothetical protein [Acinetobacter sp. ANC 4648]OTG79411.1 hypothetical protein B9T27_14535 [Acinetobacter sp. ANC 4648]
MNDFFLASNRTLTNQLGITVSQVTVKDLDHWSNQAEPIRKALKKNYSDESLEAAIQLHKLQGLLLCELVIDRDLDFLTNLISQDADQFISLFKDVVQVNKAYFDQEEDSKKRKVDKSESTWFDSFQFLISKGHIHSEIMNYTFGAYIEYLKAAQRNDRNSLLSMGNTVRVAYHADKNGFEKFANDLKNRDSR